MKTQITLALLAALGVASASERADGRRPAGEVTLPLSEVLEWIKPKAAPPSLPPIRSAISGARWKLRLGEDSPRAEAEYEVEVLTDEWAVVPLVGTTLGLRASEVADGAIVSHEGMLSLLVRGAGRRAVKLEFDVPAAAVKPGGAPIALKLPPLAGGRVEIVSRPDGVRPSIVVAGEPSDAAAIPPGGGELVVRMISDRPPEPTPWVGDVQALVRQAGGRLDVDCRVLLTGESGDGQEATILLPREALGLAITGDDLPGGAVSREETAATLRWATPGILTREVRIRYAIPLPTDGTTWTIRLPRPDGKAAFQAVVVPEAGWIVGGAEGKALTERSQWPAFAVGAADNDEAFASTKPEFVVEAKALARLEVEPARIAAAVFETRVVPDGATLSTAKFTIKHRGAMRWRFSLPEGTELLSCELDGRPVNPLEPGTGMLELPIRKGASDAGAEQQSEVRISFTGRLERIAPIEGRLALVLPVTPTFIDELAWSVRLPDGYEATAFDGNVQPVPAKGALGFRKQLVRGEAAAVEIYYRKNSH